MRRLLSALVLLGFAAPASGTDLPLPLVRATLVASLSQPVGMTTRHGDSGLYLTEKTGRVRAIRSGALDATPVLDLSSQVSQGGEQGLLGIAFSPDGACAYVNFTDLAGDTRVAEYAMAGGLAVPSSRRDVLFVDQPFDNHNGGDLLFGPDGYLYVFLGDGGSGGDPFDNGQRLNTLLGKVLRIDPRRSGSNPYTVPASNPFTGVAGARPEVWAYGLRNPWRASFDRSTGDLWIGDVGQNSWEEIDRQPAASRGGENYGWNRMEGTHPYNGGSPPPGYVPPVYDYSHVGGACSVTGGYVYRGSRNPTLAGRYIFGDFCTGRIEALVDLAGTMIALDLGATVASLTSFGEDQAGELYALSLEGGLYRLDAASV